MPDAMTASYQGRVARARTARPRAAAEPAATQATGWNPQAMNATPDWSAQASTRNADPAGTAVTRRAQPQMSERDRTILDAPYLGRSQGAMRYGVPNDPSQQWTNRDREQAMARARGAEENALRDAWWDEIGQDDVRQQRLGDQYWRSSADVTRRIQAMEDFEPTEQMGYDLSFLRDFDPSNLSRFGPTRLDGFDSSTLRGVDLSGIQGWRAQALPGVSTERLANYNGGDTIANYLERTGGFGFDGTIQAGSATFDPMAAVQRYAEGASGISNRMLKDNLEATENAAAARGRLRTGLLDADKGRVITRIGEDLNDQISSRAVDAARIEADVLMGNASNATQAAIASGRERGNLAALRSSEARDAGRLGLDAIDRATGYNVDIASALDDLSLTAADRGAGHAIDRASNIDRNALTAAEAADGLSLRRAEGMDDIRFRATDAYARQEGDRRRGIDDARQTRTRDAADLTLRERGQNQDFYDRQLDRTGDRIAGERDRITAQQNFDRALSEARKNRDWRLVQSLLQGGVSAFMASGGGG